MYRIFFIILFFINYFLVNAQKIKPLSKDSFVNDPPETKAERFGDRNSSGMYAQTQVINGDTTKVIVLPGVRVYGLRIFSNQKKQRQYAKLVYTVRKTYPYAHEAANILKRYAPAMDTMSENDIKKTFKVIEDELRAKYGNSISSMTLYQGRILLKLIDRETTNTSYVLVQQLRNGFTAFMWQGVAKLWKLNLKSAYNPEVNQEDKYIEEIVQMIENGQLSAFGLP